MLQKELPRFWLATDGRTADDVLRLIEATSDVRDPYGIKLNLDQLLQSPELIGNVRRLTNRPIFADTKTWNGKGTMDKIVRWLADEGVAIANVYALADNLLSKAAVTAHDRGVLLLAVTVLTHYTEAYCLKWFQRSLLATVRLMAETALEQGCGGYILPGTTLEIVADLGGVKFNPGVRPDWFKDKKANDQEQLQTPGVALVLDSSMVSCGSPVSKSSDPASALKDILREVEPYGLTVMV